ncbi:MAG: hypothetical protein LBC55_01950, partial [Desulfovibrio sp.]|nr:hypothetical protein [Desulfovibrio sp.]
KGNNEENKANTQSLIDKITFYRLLLKNRYKNIELISVSLDAPALPSPCNYLDSPCMFGA